jgi:hypothetical protein
MAITMTGDVTISEALYVPDILDQATDMVQNNCGTTKFLAVR